MRPEIENLINEWRQKLTRVEKLKKEIELIRNEIKTDEDKIVNIIAPEDAKVGEKFAMWMRTKHETTEFFFEVEITSYTDEHINDSTVVKRKFFGKLKIRNETYVGT